MEALPILVWSIAVALLSTAGAPIAALVFKPLPYRGAAFSLPASLLPLSVIVFWVGQMTFGIHTLAVGVLVVCLLSALAYRLGGVPEWRAVAGAYGVFLVGFVLYLLYVSHNAAITPLGGEQFLHYGLMNSLIGAESFPPEDFWYAGEPVRYYYGTQLQVAMLSMLTGTELRVGFNLGLATFYGLLFVSAYGLAGSLVASNSRSYRLGGVLGAVFVAVSGTLITTFRLLFGLLPQDTAVRYGNYAFEGIRHLDYEEAVASQGSPWEWSWFFTRYVIPDGLYEFPLYSFIKGDLHGHTLSTGYILVAGALAFSYYRTPRDQYGRRLGVLYGGLGLVGGVFGFMNTWALPTAVGLAWLAIASAAPHPATLLPASLAESLTVEQETARSSKTGPARWVGTELWRLVLAAVLAIPVALISFVVASPFLLGGVPTNGGIGFFPPRTDLVPFLLLYGGLLLLFVVFILVRSWPAAKRQSRGVRIGITVALVALSSLFLVFDFAVLAVTVPVMLAAWWLVRRDSAGFEAVLLVAGLGLLMALELVYAKVWPPDQVRWNTTLKVAIQGWTLAAVAAGAVSALLLANARERLAGLRTRETAGETATPDADSAEGPLVSTAAIGVVVVVLVTSLPFAVLAFSHGTGADGLNPADGRLDSLAVHDDTRGDEMAALSWLDEQGGPTIVEAPTRHPYQWKNVASTFTGANTIAGWNHQAGYRGEAAYDQRATQAEAVYEGPWEEGVAALRQYDIEYIYVGPSERESFASIREFDRHEGITVAFDNAAVTIYAVDQTALRPV